MALDKTARTSVTSFNPNEAEHRRELANWIRNAHEGRQLYTFSDSAGASTSRTIWDKLDEVLSVKDFGAVADGVINDTPAFQSIYNLGVAGKTIYCRVPASSAAYVLSSSPVVGAGPVIFVQDAGVSFTGAGTLPFMAPVGNKGFRVGSGQPTSPFQGGIVRIDTQMTRGDTQVAIFSHNYGGSITLPEDAVLTGSYAVDSVDTPRTWAQNTNIVKTTTSSTFADNFCCGIEISVQNQTAVVASPDAKESIIGFFVSYINPGGAGTSVGSAAIKIDGSGATSVRGWQQGIWIDNVVHNGTGLRIGNVNGTQSMGAAIDLRPHSGPFVTGAILLGNSHKVRANNTLGSAQELISLDGSNFLQLGDASMTAGLVLQPPALLLPNIATTAGASVGAATLPANPVGFIIVAIGGTSRRIPFYAA